MHKRQAIILINDGLHSHIWNGRHARYLDLDTEMIQPDHHGVNDACMFIKMTDWGYSEIIWYFQFTEALWRYMM